MIRTSSLAVTAALALGISGCGGGGGDAGGELLLDTYEPCPATEECVPSDVCLEVTTDTGGRVVTDAICTHECFDDLDCPISVTGLEGACIDIGSGFHCYERCLEDADCPAGFGCVDTEDPVPDAICLPL